MTATKVSAQETRKYLYMYLQLMSQRTVHTITARSFYFLLSVVLNKNLAPSTAY